MAPITEVRVNTVSFLEIAQDLELAGLLWRPEIGDEVADRSSAKTVSILVDPKGKTPTELRCLFIWLPTVEQMVSQLEARQAVLSHAGLELLASSMAYKTVIQSQRGLFETRAISLRQSVGLALRKLLLADSPRAVN